jgi:iron complex outermembrane receptor protein
MKKFTRILLLMSIVAISPSFAQDIEDVTVTSSILGTKSQIENPIHVIDEETLNKSGSHSIGESIDNLLGVSNTDFGSIVGQPVIRGLSGARVKVLENGLVNRDVSGIGADHPIDIDLNNIQQVEIVRGPSSLLYSNGALGGIVNVVDNTITQEDFSEQEIKLGFEHNSVNDGDVHNISFSDNIEGFNVSLAYKHQNFNNFEIPDEAVIHEPGHTEEEKDHLENSDAKIAAYKTGVSIVEDWGYFGVSFKNIENVYGIPFHGEHEEEEGGQGGGHEEEEERIESSTDSDTTNIKGAYKIASDYINQIDYFYSDTDYELVELHIGGEHNGEKTTFLNDAQELGAILDLSNDALTQKVVIRSMEEDTSILGEEAFMENVESEETSFGYYLSREFSNFDLDFGIRRDEVNRKSKVGSTAYDKDFDSTSYVLGFGFDLSSTTDLSLSIGSVERAPSSVEMFMNGEHAAVQRNERGNPNMQAEEAQNIDLGLSFDNEVIYGSINFYQNEVDKYIYRKDSGVNGTGEMKLQIANFVQKDAELDGYEIQVGTDFDFLNGNLGVTIGRDSVNGTFTDGSNIPRMVPARDIYTLSYTEDNLSVDIDLTEVNAQPDFGSDGDSFTAGFELLDLSISRSFPVEGVEDFKVVLFANNLLDEIARNHSSTVKNEVPLPGKNLGIGFRVTL